MWKLRGNWKSKLNCKRKGKWKWKRKWEKGEVRKREIKNRQGKEHEILNGKLKEKNKINQMERKKQIQCFIDRPVHLSLVMLWTDTFPFMREVSDFMHQLMRGSQASGSLSLFIYSILLLNGEMHLQSLQSSVRWLYVSAATVTLYSN